MDISFYVKHKHFNGLVVFQRAERMWKMPLAVDG
jgi:hypothetical protein